MTSTPANERSRASTNSSSQAQPPANLSKNDVDDWLAIERALSHIQSVNPSHPYVLTIPHDVEPRYHHQNQHPVQKTLWLENTPFTEKEHEASQYLTWHLHDPGDIYVQHSTRPREERGDESSRVGTPRTGGSGVKKTMSLGAYKKKVAGGTPAPEEKNAEVNGVKRESVEEKKADEERSAKNAAVKGPVERVKADEEVLAAVEDGDDTVPAVPEKNERRDESKPHLKRKREDEKEANEIDAKRRREDSKMSEDREKAQSRTEKTAAAGKQKTEAQNQDKSVMPTETSDERAPEGARQAPPSDTMGEQGRHLPTKKAKTSAFKDAPADTKNERKPVAEDNPRPKPSKSPVKGPSSPPPSKESNDMALPPRLSPLREGAKGDDSEDTSLLLPPRLSPTLPANIMATLEARKHQRSTSKSSTQGENLTPPRKTLESGISKRKSPVNGFRANSSSPMVRSDAEDTRGRSTKTSAARVRSLSRSGDESEIPVGKSVGPVKKEDKSRLIVKLKFKQRSTKESVKQLLRLPAAKKKPEPKPSPTAPRSSDSRHREQRDVNAKGVAQRVGPAGKGVAKKIEKAAPSTPTPSEKHSRDDGSDSDSRPAKRKKADQVVYEPPGKRKKTPPESLDLKQSTPAPPAQKTQHPPTPTSSVAKPSSQPVASTTAGKKSGKELLAAATTSASMKREASHDSQSQVLTPSAASSSPTASNSQSQANAVPKSTPTNTSIPAPSQPKTQRQKDWEAQRKLYDQLGRELKHAASADLTTASESKSTSTDTSTLRRLAAIKILESLLAYFLAFISDDESLAAADPPIPARTTYWRSLKDYFPFVKRNTDGFPELQGLACSLAVVFCARIVEGCVEDRASNTELMGQAWGLLSRSAGMAEGKMGVEKLRTTFPRAWAKGVEGSKEVEGKEKLVPGKFTGAYRLPLGVQTKPVVAVRAAHGILREWIEREKVGYEMRVKLE